MSLCENERASSKLSTLSNDTFENFLFLGITAGLLTVHGDYKKHFNDYKILKIVLYNICYIYVCVYKYVYIYNRNANAKLVIQKQKLNVCFKKILVFQIFYKLANCWALNYSY